MSGSRVTFVGNSMAAVVQGVHEVRKLLGEPPIVVGGLAVLARLSIPYRATVDLDVVDRRTSEPPQLDVLRAADGAESVEPAAVLLPTAYGPVRIDVLEVRQIELDVPSDDAGDRLHASAHAWANDTATPVTIEVLGAGGLHVEVTTPIAEPGPLVAMKLQAVMNRSAQKQGTDLLDIVRLCLDRATGPAAMTQIGAVNDSIARDMGIHVNHWFVDKQAQTLKWIKAVGGDDVTTDDLELVAELLTAAANRSL